MNKQVDARMKYILKGRIKNTKSYGNFFNPVSDFHDKRLETVFFDGIWNIPILF